MIFDKNQRRIIITFHKEKIDTTFEEQKILFVAFLVPDCSQEID